MTTVTDVLIDKQLSESVTTSAILLLLATVVIVVVVFDSCVDADVISGLEVDMMTSSAGLIDLAGSAAMATAGVVDSTVLGNSSIFSRTTLAVLGLLVTILLPVLLVLLLLPPLPLLRCRFFDFRSSSDGIGTGGSDDDDDDSGGAILDFFDCCDDFSAALFFDFLDAGDLRVSKAGDAGELDTLEVAAQSWIKDLLMVMIVDLRS